MGVTLRSMADTDPGKPNRKTSVRSRSDHPSRRTKVRARSGDVVALRPERLARLAQSAQRSLDEIVREYEWLYSDVYGGRSGSGESTRSDARFSDQTGTTAVNAAERSGRVRQISAVLEQMDTVLAGLAKSMRARPEGSERPDQYPPTVSPDELQLLREAKVRRESRGETGGQG